MIDTLIPEQIITVIVCPNQLTPVIPCKIVPQYVCYCYKLTSNIFTVAKHEIIDDIETFYRYYVLLLNMKTFVI